MHKLTNEIGLAAEDHVNWMVQDMNSGEVFGALTPDSSNVGRFRY
jgi:hypothetical protein